MSDKMRWRYGDTNPVMAAVDSATVIEIGDLLYLDTDDVKPASSQADQGAEATNQELFHDLFIGVAMQASANGDTDDIRIATTGVFEYDSAIGIFEVGYLLGASENASGNGLLDQTLETVAAANLALGRITKREPNPTTTVHVDIISTITRGGPQAAA